MALKKQCQPGRGTPVRNFAMGDQVQVKHQPSYDTESLTYSVNSSSVNSSTGESTDSSHFGDFLKRVINDNDVTDLSDKEMAFIKGVNGNESLDKYMIAGQNTDSRVYDDKSSILFAPAEHSNATSSRSKRSRRNHRTKQTKSISISPSPPSSPNRKKNSQKISSCPLPTPTKARNEEVWYTQWWMCGFADSLMGLSN